MVGQYLNFSALSLLTSSKTILFSLMMRTKTPRNISCQWLNSLSARVWLSAVRCINGSRLLSSISSKNMWKSVALATCVGALTNRWQIKSKLYTLEMQKARIRCPSLFNTLYEKCKMNQFDPFILAFSVFTRNRQYGKML